MSFYFSGSRDHRYLHSFPTRRSSDLIGVAKCQQRRCQEADRQNSNGHLKPYGRRLNRWRRKRPRLINEKVRDRKSTRLNSSHVAISYAVFCLKKKKKKKKTTRIQEKN